MNNDKVKSAQTPIGILGNEKTRIAFDIPWEQHDELCARCRESRIKDASVRNLDISNEQTFHYEDSARTDHYSNFIPGFSTAEDLSVPIQLLIVMQQHSGGIKKGRGDKAARSERVSGLIMEEIVLDMWHYYMHEPSTFHQWEMGRLLKFLEQHGVGWVCTDYIKCYVTNAKTGKREERYSNDEAAGTTCGFLLDQQIETLRPTTVLSLGGKTTKGYFDQILDHPLFLPKGNKAGRPYDLVISYFPSEASADKWVAVNGWVPIIPHLLPKESYGKSELDKIFGFK